MKPDSCACSLEPLLSWGGRCWQGGHLGGVWVLVRAPHGRAITMYGHMSRTPGAKLGLHGAGTSAGWAGASTISGQQAEKMCAPFVLTWAAETHTPGWVAFCGILSHNSGAESPGSRLFSSCLPAAPSHGCPSWDKLPWGVSACPPFPCFRDTRVRWLRPSLMASSWSPPFSK